MTQTTGRFFDEIARLMNDAAGVAQGVRREFDTLFKSQAERWLRDLDLVKREEFEAVKDMARLAREENEALKARLASLETGQMNRAEPVPVPAVSRDDLDALKNRITAIEAAQHARPDPSLTAASRDDVEALKARVATLEAAAQHARSEGPPPLGY